MRPDDDLALRWCKQHDPRSYKPRHLDTDRPLTGHQQIREQRAELAANGRGPGLQVLHGRHRTWDRWPLTVAEAGTEAA